MESRQLGRSARKRLQKRMASAMECYSATGEPKQKVTLLDQAQKGLITAAAKELYLSKYRTDLSKSAKVLSAEGCWAYLARNLPEARRFGLEKELRGLAAEAARRFMGDSVRTAKEPKN